MKLTYKWSVYRQQKHKENLTNTCKYSQMQFLQQELHVLTISIYGKVIARYNYSFYRESLIGIKLISRGRNWLLQINTSRCDYCWHKIILNWLKIREILSNSAAISFLNRFTIAKYPFWFCMRINVFPSLLLCFIINLSEMISNEVTSQWQQSYVVIDYTIKKQSHSP